MLKIYLWTGVTYTESSVLVFCGYIIWKGYII